MPVASSLTEELFKYVREKQISDEDLAQAGLFTLDSLACMAAGRNSETGRKLAHWAGMLFDGPDALKSLDPARGALLSGALGHVLELQATHRLSGTAPGCAVVPAVLALGQGLPIRDVLKAVLWGVEAVVRIGAATGGVHQKLWDTTSTCGPFGSALTAARLLKLTKQQAVSALGNAGTQSSGPWEFIATGTDTKALHAGRAAEAGLIAATLAALDVSGPPRILEGPRGFFQTACPDGKPDTVLVDRILPWKIYDLTYSAWPFCHLTHPAIAAAFKVREELQGRNLDPRSYNRVEIETFQAAAERCDRAELQTDREARYSLQHATACALWYGEIGVESFGEEARRTLAGKRDASFVSATLDFSMRYPESCGARVAVHHPQGGIVTAVAQHSASEPEVELDKEDLVEKAEALLTYGDYQGSETIALLAEDPTSDTPFDVSIF